MEEENQKPSDDEKNPLNFAANMALIDFLSPGIHKTMKKIDKIINRIENQKSKNKKIRGNKNGRKKKY